MFMAYNPLITNVATCSSNLTRNNWRDESMDEAMALDWLRACRSTHLYVTDVFDRVLELTQTDLNPERGWRLVKRLVELARDDRDLWQIGADPLSTIVREHEDLVGAELEVLYKTDPKYRQAFRGQMSVALYEFTRSRRLDLKQDLEPA